MLPRRSVWILAFLLVLAAGLRWHNIGAHGLAGDEKYSLFVSQFVCYEGANQLNSVRKPDNPYFTPAEFWSPKRGHDFLEAIARLDTGNGAFFTYLLHFWTAVFGVSDASLRSLAALFSVALVALLYWFVRVHFRDERLALLSAFLAAVSPFYVMYAQTARNYSLNFFFALLATHLFLLIVNGEKQRSKLPVGLLIAYGLAVLACELNHIATFPLFILHGLFVLRYVRPVFGQTWWALAGAMLIPAAGLGAWLASDGGAWLLHYVSNSVKTYTEMARTAPNDYLALTSPVSVARQMRHVVSAMFLPFDGLYRALPGAKNLLLAVSVAGASVATYQFVKNERLRPWLIGGLFIVAGLFYSVRPLHYSVLSAALLLFGMQFRALWQMPDGLEKRASVLVAAIAWGALAFLVLFAYQDGNTFRILPRYIGYAYAFGIIFTAQAVLNLLRYPRWVQAGLGGLMLVQLVLVFGLIGDVWADCAPRYFMEYGQPRQPNPYRYVAGQIMARATPADTVLYPSWTDGGAGLELPQLSVVDAQLVNFYLPKESQLHQRVEGRERNRVWLARPGGRRELLFDFKETTYRY